MPLLPPSTDSLRDCVLASLIRLYIQRPLPVLPAHGVCAIIEILLESEALVVATLDGKIVFTIIHRIHAHKYIN